MAGGSQHSPEGRKWKRSCNVRTEGHRWSARGGVLASPLCPLARIFRTATKPQPNHFTGGNRANRETARRSSHPAPLSPFPPVRIPGFEIVANMNDPNRYWHTPNRCSDRPRTIGRRVESRLPDMRAKNQTALSEWAGEKRPRRKSGFLLGFLVSWNRSIVQISWAVWPLARMPWMPGRSPRASNRLFLRDGVKRETSGLEHSRRPARLRALSQTARASSLTYKEERPSPLPRTPTAPGPNDA